MDLPAQQNFNLLLKTMQERLKNLEHEYELYFGGGRKDPPEKEQKELERQIRELSRLAVNSTQNQYLFNNFQQSYVLRKARWAKLVELKLNGISQDPRLTSRVRLDTKAFTDLEKAKPEDIKKEIQEQDKKPAVRETTKKEEDTSIRALFEEFNRAKQTLGQTLELDPSSFEKKLEKQKKELMEKHKAKDVKFTVSISDGKVSLKAKLIK